MVITPANIVRHELIGLKAKVVAAKNPQNIGLWGEVVNETYKTLVLEHKGKEKRIFKAQVKLHLTLPNKTIVEVDGRLLVGRPWDRIKRKLPKVFAS